MANVGPSVVVANLFIAFLLYSFGGEGARDGRTTTTPVVVLANCECFTRGGKKEKSSSPYSYVVTEKIVGRGDQKS